MMFVVIIVEEGYQIPKNQNRYTVNRKIKFTITQM